MNARISRNFVFQAAIHHDDTFIMNFYSITLYMDVLDDDVYDQNVALDRIKFIFEKSFENCVFIESAEKIAIENYLKAGIRVSTLPEEPYDQVIAALIMNKINCVTENKLFVTQIKLHSTCSDDVEFYISHDENMEFLQKKNTWWNSSDTNISDWFQKVNKKDKVVQIKKGSVEWGDIGLLWKKDKDKNQADIVFLNTEKPN